LASASSVGCRTGELFRLPEGTAVAEPGVGRILQTPPPLAIAEAGGAGVVGAGELQAHLAPTQHHASSHRHRRIAGIGDRGVIHRALHQHGGEWIAVAEEGLGLERGHGLGREGPAEGGEGAPGDHPGEQPRGKPTRCAPMGRRPYSAATVVPRSSPNWTLGGHSLHINAQPFSRTAPPIGEDGQPPKQRPRGGSQCPGGAHHGRLCSGCGARLGF
jgi:hypothetical protein